MSAARLKIRTAVTTDAGLSLAELLVTVAMIGIAFSVLIGGMYSYSVASVSHRSQAEAQLELRKYAEAAAATTYTDMCAPVAATYVVANYAAPAGFTVANSVKLWDPVALTFTITPAAGCTDPNLQLVTVTVTRNATPSYTESVDIVKRAP